VFLAALSGGRCTTVKKVKKCNSILLKVNGTTVENVTVQRLLGIYVGNIVNWHY
jgi:hypothetical protein